MIDHKVIIFNRTIEKNSGKNLKIDKIYTSKNFDKFIIISIE